MATDYARGYSKGYNTGRQCRWHDHKPPAPPDEITGKLVRVLSELRDAADVVELDEDRNLILNHLHQILEADHPGTHWLAERAADKERLEAADEALNRIKESKKVDMHTARGIVSDALERYDALKPAEDETEETNNA